MQRFLLLSSLRAGGSKLLRNQSTTASTASTQSSLLHSATTTTTSRIANSSLLSRANKKLAHFPTFNPATKPCNFSTSSLPKSSHPWLTSWWSLKKRQMSTIKTKISRYYCEQEELAGKSIRGFESEYRCRLCKFLPSTVQAWIGRQTGVKMLRCLIITNFLVAVLWITQNDQLHQFMLNNFTVSVENFTSGRLHTLITSAFGHEDFRTFQYNIYWIMLAAFWLDAAALHGSKIAGAGFLLELYLSAAVVGSLFYLMGASFMLIPQELKSKMNDLLQHLPAYGEGKLRILGPKIFFDASVMLSYAIVFRKASAPFVAVVEVPALVLLGPLIALKEHIEKTYLKQSDPVSGLSALVGGVAVTALMLRGMRYVPVKNGLKALQ